MWRQPSLAGACATVFIHSTTGKAKKRGNSVEFWKNVRDTAATIRRAYCVLYNVIARPEGPTQQSSVNIHEPQKLADTRIK
jgi:hypothetical protein